MLIPSNYYIKDDAELPTGCVERKCRICNSRFAVPEKEAANLSDVCDAESCKEAVDKEAAAAAAALMKPKTDAADTVSKALGK